MQSREDQESDSKQLLKNEDQLFNMEELLGSCNSILKE
jgi:hypothetical protein